MVVSEILIATTMLQPLGAGAVHYYLKKNMDRLKDSGKLFQVLVEKDSVNKPSVIQDFWEKFSGIYNPRKPVEYISFEIHGNQYGIEFCVWVPGNLEDFIQRNLNSIHTAGEIHPLQHDYIDNLNGKTVKCTNMELERDFSFNILQSMGDRYSADPINSICSAISNLKDGEDIVLQFIVRPLHHQRLTICKNNYKNYVDFKNNQPVVKNPLKDYFPLYFGVFKGIRDMIIRTGYNVKGDSTPLVSPREELFKSMLQKSESTCLMDITIRIASASPSTARAQSNLLSATSAFSVLADKNRFKVVRQQNTTKFLKSMKQRSCPIEAGNNLLSPSEMASFLHYPEGSVPFIKRLTSKKLPVPEGILVYNSYEEAKDDSAIVFGISNFRGKVKYVAFKDIRMLMQHMYMIGATGSGKTTLLTTLLLEVLDICGATFFDVKGDSVKEIMRYIPKTAESRINYIDFSDDDFYLPFNVLKLPGMGVYDLASLIVEVFVTVFGEQSIQFHSQRVLRNALIAVLSTNPDGSILEVYRMFTDEAYLWDTINKLEAFGEFPDVLSYWGEYYNMSYSKREQQHGAILNKLELITQNKRPRYTLCQKNNILNFRKLIDERAINLVNLDMGKNTATIQRFFGTIITAFIRNAFYSRSNIPESSRVPHLFILDEFEKFTKQGEDFQDMLALVRSYGGGLILTHQSIKQLDETMMALIADNTFTQISLNIGDNSGDRVKKMFPGITSDDLTGLTPHQAVARLKKLNPQPFTFETLDFRSYYKDNGETYVNRFIDRVHKLKYQHILTIKDDINERYKLVMVDGGVPPKVTGKDSSGKLTKSKGERHGKKDKQIQEA
jgi:hypothetical protein